MANFTPQYDGSPVAFPTSMIVRGNARFTMLTDRLIRMEYSENGVFEDRATRLAVNRALDHPHFTVEDGDGITVISTEALKLTYRGGAFSADTLSVWLGGRTWYFGTACDNLGGTVRTLDNKNGAVPLGDGILSRTAGFAVIDDSKTIAIGDGYPVPVSAEGRVDCYLFAYGREYRRAVRDFYRLTGPVPLIPRFAFGNWWSRYHDYSADEYAALMDDFAAHRVPLAAAVIDMDWHVTEVPDPVKYGRGWTGYTWNKELIPDPEAFLADLHRRGLKTTLNLHPADGIRDYEEAYPRICAALGRPADGTPVAFDVSDERFMRAYFDTVLHPLEDEGCDFWWIDWQQSGGTSVPGYDPLWMLNHCHYLDNAAADKRPLILSRYAELGSHRYPIGFSGDTHITWASLAFQPYFTATAANVGFTFWSHDIGGHMFGSCRDRELYVRWLQFGVFSPIMRLHSSSFPRDFISKEPWNFGIEAETIAESFLRLRHQLVPYIYTEACRVNTEGVAMLRPLYHDYPNDGGAYAVKKEYLFGDLIVAPVTDPRDPGTMLGMTEAWLPAGRWYDFFTGMAYSGGRTVTLYRPLSQLPVLMRAGTVLPLAAETSENGVALPRDMTVVVCAGADGSYTLREDDDRPAAVCRVAETKFDFTFGADSTLRFTHPACEAVPASRRFTFRLVGFAEPTGVSVDVNGSRTALAFRYDKECNTVTTASVTVKAGERVTLTVQTDGSLPKNNVPAAVHKMLLDANLPTGNYTTVWDLVSGKLPRLAQVAALSRAKLSEPLLGALLELLCADGE